jgi:hypothetical protein
MLVCSYLEFLIEQCQHVCAAKLWAMGGYAINLRDLKNEAKPVTVA